MNSIPCHNDTISTLNCNVKKKQILNRETIAPQTVSELIYRDTREGGREHKLIIKAWAENIWHHAWKLILPLQATGDNDNIHGVINNIDDDDNDEFDEEEQEDDDDDDDNDENTCILDCFILH